MRRLRLLISLGILLALLLSLTSGAEIAKADCDRCEVAPPCFNYCDDDDGGQEPPGDPDPGDDPPGDPGENPPEVTPEPGETPPPAYTYEPLPTMTPPGGGSAGYWDIGCADDARFCSTGPAVVTRWCEYGNPLYCHVISARCAVPGECNVVTATPPPPVPDGDWPCGEEPYVVDGRLIQACPRWPGWEIDVEVLIPPADVLRNPWPRSLVAYPTKLWFAGASDVEAWSERALACTVDYGVTYPDPANFPACAAVGGQVSEGTEVNYQVGAAWRRWDASQGAIFDFTPPYEIGWSIPDRAFNGGTQQKYGPSVVYTFETSSWGLTENGPTWHPACQESECGCDARVQGWDTPAYQVVVTTWWYPQYNFRYDEFYCASHGWSDCFCRAAGEPGGQPHTRCDNPPASCDVANGAWYGRIQTCDGWSWRNVEDGWQTYDLSQVGYRPVVPWYVSRQAGAEPDGTQCGAFGPSSGAVAIPVIEVQPVAP